MTAHDAVAVPCRDAASCCREPSRLTFLYVGPADLQSQARSTALTLPSASLRHTYTFENLSLLTSVINISDELHPPKKKLMYASITGQIGAILFILATIFVPVCLYCLNCTKFDQLILRKIIKIVATRCHILRLKCTKFDFGWGSAPDPAGGAHSAPPDPLAGFYGSYF